MTQNSKTSQGAGGDRNPLSGAERTGEFRIGLDASAPTILMPSAVRRFGLLPAIPLRRGKLKNATILRVHPFQNPVKQILRFFFFVQKSMEGAARLELATFGFVDRRSFIQLSYAPSFKMVGDGNFEIPAPRSQSECSASELIPVKISSRFL